MLPSHVPIPVSSKRSFLAKDNPLNWTKDVEVIAADVGINKQKEPYYKNYRPVDMRVLYPCTDYLDIHTTHLPCLEMREYRTFPWANRAYKNVLARAAGQVEWIQYMLIHERDILERAGVYKAVYLSLFDYKVISPLVQAFAERWSYVTNTVYVGDREMTPTLWELSQMSGLPIYGTPYDEFIPKNEKLSDFPGSFGLILNIYNDLLENSSNVTLKKWVAYFTDQVKDPVGGFADPKDPLGTGKLEIYHTGDEIERVTLDSHDLSRESRRTAFFAWWLNYFVIPSQPIGKLRPSTFIAASLMAQGQRLALAIPALANVYSSLRFVASHTNPSFCKALIPLHFICGWLALYWPGIYHPTISQKLRDNLPFMASVAAASPTAIGPTAARSYFSRSDAHFKDYLKRLISPTSPSGERYIVDSHSFFRDVLRDVKKLEYLEFYISLRYGFLPLRIRELMVIEPYMPHQCAHQFGLDQDLPMVVICPKSLSVDLDGLGWCWDFLLRTDTGSSFLISKTLRTPYFSASYLRWFYRLIGSLRSIPDDFLDELNHGIEEIKARGTRKRKCQTSSGHDLEDNESSTLLTAPPDFMGRDSRYSHTPSRSFIAGIPFLSHCDLSFL
jgi:Plant mobile domain